MALHWGIAGASKIAHDFCIALAQGADHKIISIASRYKDSANEFAKRHNIQHTYGCYEELAKDANVEVVYITVLNPHHFEVAKLMITHGKHVVCEKPFAMNYGQAKELFALAEQYRVFLMEALWSRFFPVYRHLERLIDFNSFGDIKEVYVKHGFIGAESERIMKKELGGGIVLDIGCYAIQLALFIFREAPKTIKAQGKVNSNGVDLYFEAVLTFSNGKSATLTCSGLEELENQATIITTKGPICIPQYWCPTKYIALGNLHQWDLVSSSSEFTMNYTNSLGLIYEADEVFKCIRSGKLQCDIVPPADTLLIARIQDEIRKQIGVYYDCDKY